MMMTQNVHYMISLTVIILDMNTKTTRHTAAMVDGWSGRMPSSCTMSPVIWYITLSINISLLLHGGINNNPSSIHWFVLCDSNVKVKLWRGSVGSIRSCLCLRVVQYWFLFWFQLCYWHGFDRSHPHMKKISTNEMKKFFFA